MSHLIRNPGPRLLGSVLLVAAMAGNGLAQVQEIEDAGLPVVVMVKFDPELGTAVVYNPDTCNRLGSTCRFLRVHAQAHVYYGHPPAHPSDYSDREETLADCWAARHGEPMEILAAHQWFNSGTGQEGLGVYGDTKARAKIIRTCALQEDNWLGN